MDTLTPLIPGSDQTGRFMHGLLRRALKSASKEDLEQVVLHCVAFTDGLRANGFITEELARQASSFLNPGAIHDAISTDGTTDNSSSDWLALPGQGTTDWTDEEWQEHSGEASDHVLPGGHAGGDEQGMEASTDLGGGHQTTVEGDNHTNGEEHAEALPEDGAG